MDGVPFDDRHFRFRLREIRKHANKRGRILRDKERFEVHMYPSWIVMNKSKSHLLQRNNAQAGLGCQGVPMTTLLQMVGFFRMTFVQTPIRFGFWKNHENEVKTFPFYGFLWKWLFE